MSDIRWRRAVRRPLAPILASGLAVAVAAGALAADRGTEQARSPEDGAAGAVVLTQALERVDTSTVTDWVNVADHVVAVTVTGEGRLEQETSPDREGRIGREVTLSVGEVPWTSSDTARPVPDTVTLPVSGGWIRDDDGTERETSPAGSSRLEVGNGYVVALVWKPAQCAGDLRSPARWAIAGSGAVVPATDGRLGVGEFEGSAAGDPSAGEYVGPPVVDELGGEDVAALAEVLARTEVTEDVEFVMPDEGCAT